MVPWLLGFSLAHADPPVEPRGRDAVSLGYSAGVMGFVGDLSDDRARWVQEAQVETLFLRSASGRVGGHLAIAAAWGDIRHDGDAFPFPEDAQLKVLSFLFVANLCGRPIPSLEGCLGLGESTVNINAPLHRRDYGTWNYAAELDWNPVSRLSAVARVRFIGAVEQQVDGVDSAFSLYTATGGLAWTF